MPLAKIFINDAGKYNSPLALNFECLSGHISIGLWSEWGLLALKTGTELMNSKVPAGPHVW